MDQMSDGGAAGALAPGDFYDHLAPSYDLMTGFASRFEREQPVFQRLVAAYGIRTAVDAGAGSGFHALLLAKMGVRVTAIDVSEKMLDLAARHAQEMSVSVSFARAPFEQLAQAVRDPVDAVFCLGNSLPHLTSDAELHRALANFRQVLKPEGVVIAQLLNYEKIISRRERIVGVQQKDEVMFVRFYDFVDPLLRFNILLLHHRAGQWEPELQSTLLRPYTKKTLASGFAEAGFEALSVYGSLALDDFVPMQSRDLVIVAR